MSPQELNTNGPVVLSEIWPEAVALRALSFGKLTLPFSRAGGLGLKSNPAAVWVGGGVAEFFPEYITPSSRGGEKGKR
jgi:hypothetical protein